MVFVNDKKFACESCIKGHRSSSCTHSDRPLFAVAKKGRPVSQCEKCRELRQSKRFHSKCQCPKEPQQSRGILLASASSKSRRYLPIAPALPNGLRDVASDSSSTPASDPRQRVGSLLNPCDCQIGRRCRCRPKQQPKRSVSKAQPTASTSASVKPSLTLAPIRFPVDDSPALIPEIPEFETTMLPSMSTISSLAGTGCTCGVECGCPGCVEHRGSEHAAASGHHACNSGCGACVDSRGGIALNLPCMGLSPGNSTIDRFFARAAALPPPPTSRGVVVNLPKLCCGGKCGCPDGSCSCGKVCDGCCVEHSGEQRHSTPEPRQVLPAPEKKSCCCS